MQQKLKMRSVFWTTVGAVLLCNVICLIIFKNSIALSMYSFYTLCFFIVAFLRGIAAFAGKDELVFFVSKRVSFGKFTKYNKPTNKQLNEFYFYATIYFAVIPFYLPLAVFCSGYVCLLWNLFLTAAPQLVMMGIEIWKMRMVRKEAKAKKELLERERREQEKREELGYWK